MIHKDCKSFHALPYKKGEEECDEFAGLIDFCCTNPATGNGPGICDENCPYYEKNDTNKENSMSDNEKGLYAKYKVTKIEDGSTVENCFVLRPDKDLAAVHALRTYAEHSRNAQLSCDIYQWVGMGEPSKEINTHVDTAHRIAVAHGWWEKPAEFGTLVALIHSEASEALEEYRNGHEPNETYYSKDKYGKDKMEGVPSELADIVIRVMDLCGAYGIDLAKAIEEKMLYNAQRPYKHGGKKV